jgi:predicted SAM-dependent methyltransferase
MSRGFFLLLKRVVALFGFPVEFGRLGKLELQIFVVRWFYQFSPEQILKIRRLNRRQELWINFGCGVKPFPGWLNVDGIPNSLADLHLDIRCRLPFHSGKTRFIFAEHVIEHLRLEEAEFFLEECHRILGAGGSIRLITPDLEKFVQAYVQGNQEFFQVASPRLLEPVRALNFMFRQGGTHQYVYDFPELERVLHRAGFQDVARSSYRKSSWPELNLDQSSEQRQAESLYVEAVKRGR